MLHQSAAICKSLFDQFSSRRLIKATRLNLSVISFSLILFSSCREKQEIPDPEIIQNYQKHAHLFCNAVTECFKKDAEARLKDYPERAKLIVSKMNSDLCIENQYLLIGKSSATVFNREKFSTNTVYYKVYENCAIAVSSKENCIDRLNEYKNHPDCKKLKQNI
ncbi:MAG: hypothetical protein OEZ34_13800 [Spirochaetia bacterium]|nr:hypothetical protein [Spirochaetia bacterium]